MNYFLLDTNVYVQDFWMNGNSMITFLDNFSIMAENIPLSQCNTSVERNRDK